MAPHRQLPIQDQQEEVKQLRAIFNTVSDAIIVFDENFYVQHVNKAASQLFEKKYDELIACQLKDFLMLFPYDVINDYYPTLVENQKFTYEGTMSLQNGIVKYVEFTCEQRSEASGSTICTFRDITAQKMVENERFLSQHMFMDVFNEAVDGIVIFDRAGQLIDVNPSFCDRLNFSKEYLLTKTLTELVEPAYHYKLKKVMAPSSATGQSERRTSN